MENQSINPEEGAKNVSKYDPSLTYQWSSDEKFTIIGVELEYMFRSVAEYLQLPESQHVLRMLDIHKLLESKIRIGIEEGKVVPQDTPVKQD